MMAQSSNFTARDFAPPRPCPLVAVRAAAPCLRPWEEADAVHWLRRAWSSSEEEDRDLRERAEEDGRQELAGFCEGARQWREDLDAASVP